MADETTQAPVIDMAAIEAEVSKLSSADLVKALTDVRVRQKVQQKKQYAKGTMKQYQQKQLAKRKAMREQALTLPGTEKDPRTGEKFTSLWEQITFHADAEANRQFEAQVAASVDEEPEDEQAATT
jgi:osmotically-inducible protein OsmY